MTTRQPSKICRHQDCPNDIPPWFNLCVPHNADKRKGEISQCSNCERYKPDKYPRCRNCNAEQNKYEPESDPTWDDDSGHEDNEFFIYILKLDDGKFYAGHTRELRERMGEHRDGKAKSTADKNPLLVWFEIVDTRKEAAEREAQLKELIDKNERKVRRIVNKFQDFVRLVNLD